MNKTYLMTCGHTNNAMTSKGKPICVICMCVKISKVVNNSNGLENRIAKCHYCKHKKQSNWNLPYFKYCPKNNFDDYYCGCLGWD